MVSKRRDDVRDYRRKKPVRNPRFRILIVCEGQVTERKYFKAFQHDVKNPRVHVELPDQTGVPLTVVKTAARLASEANEDAERQRDENLRFDSVWAVFDVDAHPHLAEARALAANSNVHLAVSNPCFELWALLHLDDQRAHIERGVLASRLRTHLPDYDKHLPYDILKDGYLEAVRRAESLWAEAEHHCDPGRNPSTEVFRLTELIRTK